MALLSAVGTTIKTGLGVLGITAVEEMRQDAALDGE
jgi:arginyl-tRNA synthetase